MITIKHIPKGWRKGQFIFNFLEWIKIQYYHDKSKTTRMIDPFYITDEQFDKYYNEYIKTLTI